MSNQHKGATPEYRYRSRALEVISRNLDPEHKPAVLELGPARANTVEYFGQFSGSLFVADLREIVLRHSAHLTDSSGEETYLNPRARSAECLEALPSEGSFDLILCWDLFNYLEENELRTLLTRLAKYLRPGSLLLTLLSDRATALPGPLQCSICSQEEVLLVSESTEVQPLFACRESVIRGQLKNVELESAVRLRNGICELLFVATQEEKTNKKSPKHRERP